MIITLLGLGVAALIELCVDHTITVVGQTIYIYMICIRPPKAAHQVRTPVDESTVTAN
jgi:hypothetical protein